MEGDLNIERWREKLKGGVVEIDLKEESGGRYLNRERWRERFNREMWRERFKLRWRYVERDLKEES